MREDKPSTQRNETGGDVARRACRGRARQGEWSALTGRRCPWWRDRLPALDPRQAPVSVRIEAEPCPCALALPVLVIEARRAHSQPMDETSLAVEPAASGAGEPEIRDPRGETNRMGTDLRLRAGHSGGCLPAKAAHR